MGNGVAAWIGGHRRWVWLVTGVAVLALLTFGVARALTAGAIEEPEAAATVVVDRGAVTAEVATTGTLQPAQTRNLSFTVAGTVESVSVRAGTEVTAGQELAKVDATDATTAVDSARDALDQAEDALSAAKRSAVNATSTPTHASPTCAAPGRSAAPGPSITRTGTPTRSPTPVPATQGTTRGTPAASCPADRGGSAQGGGQSGAQGGDAVLSAEQRVTQADLTLENAEAALDGATITAPIAGRILSVSGRTGTQVGAGSTFITLADVYDMQISARFPEADADRLAVRLTATATLADRPGKDFGARVVQVDPVGTSDGTMVRYGVLLSFTDPPKDLLVGQSAAVRVTTGSAGDVLRVPSTALHDVTGDTATALRSDGGVTSPVTVTIGLRGDRYTEVRSGLTEGEAVVRSW